MLAFIVINCGLLGLDSLNVFREKSKTIELRNDVKEISDRIDNDNRDKVIGYNAPIAFYLESGIMPCYANFHIQDFQAEYDKELKNKILDDIKSGKAIYIVESNNNKTMADSIIKKSYDEIYKNKNLVLIKKKK